MFRTFILLKARSHMDKILQELRIMPFNGNTFVKILKIALLFCKNNVKNAASEG